MVDFETPIRKPSTTPGTHISFHDSSYIKTNIYTVSTSNRDDVEIKVVKNNQPLSRNYFKETGGTNNGW